jgi:plasmid stability protein
MGIMVQIRNVPPELHRKLKARAALAGRSLSDYLLDELRHSAEVPTREELVERLRQLPPVPIRETAAQAIAAERRIRETALAERVAGRPRPVARRRARR